MKILLLIISLMFIGCTSPFNKNQSPNFKVSECFAESNDVDRAKMPKESWEEDRSYRIYKVLAVGILKYRVLEDYGYGSMSISSFDFNWQDIVTKVECTKRLEDYRE